MRNIWATKSQQDFCLKGYGKFLHRQRAKYLKEILIRLISNDGHLGPKNIIDLGCGEGVLTRELPMKNLRIFAADYDINRILKAKSAILLNIEFFVSDVLNIALKEKCADIILFHHVVEHLDNSDEQAIENCQYILKDGGYLILGIPNEDSLLGMISRKIHHNLYTKGEHVNFYSESSITAMLKAKGFRPVSTYRIGFLFPIYYLHMIFISMETTFFLGQLLTNLLKCTADSLIIISRKETKL